MAEAVDIRDRGGCLCAARLKRKVIIEIGMFGQLFMLLIGWRLEGVPPTSDMRY